MNSISNFDNLQTVNRVKNQNIRLYLDSQVKRLEHISRLILEKTKYSFEKYQII